MKKTMTKISTLIIGIVISGIVYLSLWSIFKYFGIVN